MPGGIAESGKVKRIQTKDYECSIIEYDYVV